MNYKLNKKYHFINSDNESEYLNRAVYLQRSNDYFIINKDHLLEEPKRKITARSIKELLKKLNND